MAESLEELLFEEGLNDEEEERSLIRPLYSVNLDEDKDITKWLNNTLETLHDSDLARVKMQKLCRRFFAGVQDVRRHDTRTARDTELYDWHSRLNNATKVVVNHTYDLIMQKVNKMTRFMPAIDVYPANAEENDRSSARAAQEWLDYIFYINDLDTKVEKFARNNYVDGEAYIHVKYDKRLGRVHPDAAKADKEGMLIPLEENGKKIVGYDGKPLYHDKRKRVGEVSFEVVDSMYMTLEPKLREEDVNWCIRREIVDVDDLRLEHPDKADKLEDISLNKNTDGSYGPEFQRARRCMVYHIYHRHHWALSQGRYIKVANGQVLENSDLGHSHGDLPFVRITDMDVPGCLYGLPAMLNIMRPQLMINNLYALAYKNIALGSHLYWLIPSQSKIARDKIRNMASVLTYNAGFKPEIATFRTVGGEVFTMIDRLERVSQVLYGIQGMSRGNLPPNVEAGRAFAILEEQENQRANTDIKKLNRSIKQCGQFAIGDAGDNYDESDGRTVAVLGKDSAWALKTLDVSKLSSEVDIRIRRKTAFSESKESRIGQITEFEAMRPGFLSDQQLYDLLELGNDEKFMTLATSALRNAEFENEQMAEGIEVPEPELTEELAVHWLTHIKDMQSPNYTQEADEGVRKIKRDHLELTEFLLVEKSKKNLALAQRLAALEYFPSIYEPEVQMPEILNALSQGQIIPPRASLQEPVMPPMQDPSLEEPLAAEGEPLPEEVPAAVEEPPVLPEEQVEQLPPELV